MAMPINIWRSETFSYGHQTLQLDISIILMVVFMGKWSPEWRVWQIAMFDHRRVYLHSHPQKEFVAAIIYIYIYIYIHLCTLSMYWLLEPLELHAYIFFKCQKEQSCYIQSIVHIYIYTYIYIYVMYSNYMCVLDLDSSMRILWLFIIMRINIYIYICVWRIANQLEHRRASNIGHALIWCNVFILTSYAHANKHTRTARLLWSIVG